MKLSSLSRLTKNTRRFEEIVRTLAKYGLADWIKDSYPDLIKDLYKSARGQPITGISTDARVRMALTDLGTTFIKIGQLLSTRPDLVGPSLAEELSMLQSSVPADPPETVRATLEAELGRPAGDLFAEFSETPAASASIGQVHEARLPGGQRVVVKIQHEGIEERITTDLDILFLLADLAEKSSSEVRLYQPRAVIADFRRVLLGELDFRREARNQALFARNFERSPAVRIPETYPDLSGRRVLTMEKLEGFSVADTARLAEERVDTAEVARLGANVYLDMIFRDGFYHADPHPGNIWILRDGSLALLDFGMVGRLDGQRRTEFEDLLFAAVQRDAGRLTDAVIRIGTLPPEFDRDRLRTEVGDFVGEYVDQSLKDLDMSEALSGMTDIIRRHRIILPSSISLLLKVLVQLEGTSRSLQAEFNLAEVLKPYYAKVVARRYAPAEILARLQRSFRDWERLLDILPGDLSDILSRLRTGKFDVHIQHRRVDATTNRLIYGIITASILLASAVLLSAKVPPAPWEISLWGVGGFLVATVLGFRLWRSIGKSGGLGGR